MLGEVRPRLNDLKEIRGPLGAGGQMVGNDLVLST